MDKWVDKEKFETFKHNIGKRINAKQNKIQVATEALSANKTLKAYDRKVQFLDPGGSNRDITLPAEATSGNMFFFIINIADGAEDLLIKDDSAALIITISQNEGGVVFCNDEGVSSVWRGFVGGIT